MVTFLARRSAPKPVKPLVQNGVRYEVMLRTHRRGFSQSGGIIMAIDDDTDEELWNLIVYHDEIDPKWERDTQGAYITTITGSEDGQTIVVTNQFDRRYEVRLSDKSITELPRIE